MIENRVADLEIKLAQQDDLLDTLNRTIYRQQQKIDELETLCTVLARHLKEIRQAAEASGASEEKPPHY